MKQNRKPLKKQLQEGRTVVQPPKWEQPAIALLHAKISNYPRECKRGGGGNGLGLPNLKKMSSPKA